MDMRGLSWACALLLLGACQGDIETDGGGGDPDTWQPDAPLPADIAPVGDGAPVDLAHDHKLVGEGGGPGDQGPKGDGSPPGPCADWSKWTCQPDATYLCKATCQQGGQSLTLTCITAGTCVCGLVGISPCGPYTYTKPCDACKAAVVDGCCD